jgi:twinkle protein
MINKSDLLDFGIEHRGRWSEEIKTLCPKCSDKRRKKKEPCLAVNTITGLFTCHHCAWSGVIKKDNMNETKFIRPKVVKSSPPPNKILEYFKSRGITKEVVDRNKITQCNVYMPQVQKNRDSICFNYFRDGELINIKYRDGDKNFKQVAGAEKIFYGLDDIKDSNSCIIVEGEIDKLSFDVIGKTECVSVPDGAPNPNAKNVETKFSYLDNCHSYFDNMDVIFIAVDNDANGRRLLEELSRRLGKERIMIIDFPEECKDANDVLVKLGKKALESCYDNARDYPVDGVFSVTDVESSMIDSFTNGKVKGLSTGYATLDPHYTFRMAEFDVFTGIPGHGKTSFCFQLMMNGSILYGWKWGVFSPENYPITELYETLVEMYIGKTSDIDSSQRMSMTEYTRGMKFVNKHFFVVYPEDSFSLSNVLDKFKHLVLRKGIKGVLIDPYNQLDHNYKGMSEALYVAETLNKIRKFTKNYHLKFIVIAHPITMRSDKGTGDNEVPTAYRISGGSNWYNKADNIVTVHRPNPKDFRDTTVDIHVQKIKFQKLVGVPTGTPVKLNYHRPSNRFNIFGGDYPLEDLVNISDNLLPY